MNFEVITEIVMEMTMLPYFPSDPAARLAIVRMVGSMCSDEAQVRWLVNVMTSGAYEKWEGPSELRAVLCQKFKPKDGIEAISRVYPDGMTREQLNPGVVVLPVAHPVLALQAGPVSASPSIVAMVDDLCVAKDLNRAIDGTLPRKPVRLIPIHPPLTQERRQRLIEDLAQAEREYRAQKDAQLTKAALEDLGL